MTSPGARRILASRAAARRGNRDDVPPVITIVASLIGASDAFVQTSAPMNRQRLGASAHRHEQQRKPQTASWQRRLLGRPSSKSDRRCAEAP